MTYLKNLVSALTLIISLVVLSGCGSFRDSPKYQLADDVYHFRQKDTAYQKAWVYVNGDSVRILTYNNSDKLIDPKPGEDQFFLKRSFDVDVMTVAFKYRPSTVNLPRQLDTDFNGNVYLGYRFDRFRIKYKKTPFGPKRAFGHRGITAGFFGGMAQRRLHPGRLTI
jgi:hypothetical protein